MFILWLLFLDVVGSAVRCAVWCGPRSDQCACTAPLPTCYVRCSRLGNIGLRGVSARIDCHRSLTCGQRLGCGLDGSTVTNQPGLVVGVLWGAAPSVLGVSHCSPRSVPFLAKSLRSQSRRAPLSAGSTGGNGAIYRHRRPLTLEATH